MAPPVRVRLTTALAAVLIAVLLPACGGGGGSTSGPEQTVDRYLKAWNAQDYAAMAKLVVKPPADFEQFQRDRLDEVRASALVSALDGAIREHGERATASLAHTVTSPPWGDWATTGKLALVKRNDVWKVRWSPQAIDTALLDGATYSTDLTWPERAPVLGAGGQPLTLLGPMTRVGVQGSRVTDRTPLTAALQLAGASQEKIDAALKTAGEHPDWFVPVTEITAARY